MKIISYTSILNGSKQAADHGKNMPKDHKFKSGAELTDYLNQVFNKEQHLIQWYANSPSQLLLAVNNELVTVNLFMLKHLDKYLLDTLLFNSGLIKQRFFIDNASIVTVKEITEPIHFGG